MNCTCRNSLSTHNGFALTKLQDTIRMAKARDPAVPDSGPLLARAEEILVQGLRDRLAEEESAVRELPGTPDGLVRSH